MFHLNIINLLQLRIGLRMTEEGGGGIIVRILTLIQRFFDQNYDQTSYQGLST